MEDVQFKREMNLQEVEKIQDEYIIEDKMITQIDVDENFDIKVNDETHKATSDFFQAFYGILGIPYPFTRKIPPDLVITNVDRLKELSNIPVKIVRRDDTLVNIVPNINRKGNPVFFKNVNTSLLLDSFSSDSFDLKNCYVGDEGAVIDVVHKDLGQIILDKKNVGDIIEVGYRIRNPFTMFDNKLSMSIYLNQLVCLNGMVLGKEFSSSVVNLNKDIGDEQVFIERFRNNIDSNVGRRYSLENLIDLYSKLNITEIKNRWLKPIMNTVKKIGDGDMFSKVFGFDWEEESDFYKKSFEEDENGDSEWKYFDTIYKITKHAQKESTRDRLFLEEYNNKIVNLYNKQILVTSNN